MSLHRRHSHTILSGKSKLNVSMANREEGAFVCDTSEIRSSQLLVAALLVVLQLGCSNRPILKTK